MSRARKHERAARLGARIFFGPQLEAIACAATLPAAQAARDQLLTAFRVLALATIAISTRRFAGRPASVSLVAIGSVSPRPHRLKPSRAHALRRQIVGAAVARRCESARLYSLVPTSSVCPTMSKSVFGYFARLDTRLRRFCAASERMTSD